MYIMFLGGLSHMSGIRANRDVVTGLSGNTVAYLK